MIYIDNSVALAHLLAEPRSPPVSFWNAPLVSSQSLEYEIWNRIHAYGLGRSHGNEVQELLLRVGLIEMTAGARASAGAHSRSRHALLTAFISRPSSMSGDVARRSSLRAMIGACSLRPAR